MNSSSKEQRLKFLSAAIVIAIVLVLSFGFEKESLKKQDKIGFIMISNDIDSQWQKDQLDAMKSACEYTNAQLFVKSNVKEEAIACKEAVSDLINNGVGMIFIASYSYAAPLKNISREYPDVAFATNSQFYYAPNLSSYNVRMYQGRYLSGAIAGMRTKTNVIGYVAAVPTSIVNLEINAFTLGVQQTNPNAKVVVAWTNSWQNVSKEASATKRLIQDVQADVITYHQDNQTVADIAESLNVEYIGYNEPFENYSDKHLVSVECRWDIYYRNVVNNYLKGELNYATNNWLDIDTKAIELKNYSDVITPEMKMKVEVLRQQIINGRNIFSGLIYDNYNNIICAADETISDKALLDKTNWLVKGVQILE